MIALYSRIYDGALRHSKHYLVIKQITQNYPIVVYSCHKAGMHFIRDTYVLIRFNNATTWSNFSVVYS